jgi:hypothetical protein
MHSGHIEGNDLHKRKANLIKSLFFQEGDNLPINLVKSEESDLEKGAGEGSRGGRIIGHYANGKPMYASLHGGVVKPIPTTNDIHSSMAGLGYKHEGSDDGGSSKIHKHTYSHTKDGHKVTISEKMPDGRAGSYDNKRKLNLSSIHNADTTHIKNYHDNYNTGNGHTPIPGGGFGKDKNYSADHGSHYNTGDLSDESIKDTGDLEKQMKQIGDAKSGKNLKRKLGDKQHLKEFDDDGSKPIGSTHHDYNSNEFKKQSDNTWRLHRKNSNS